MTDVTVSRVIAYPSMGLTEVILRTGTTCTGATDTLTMDLSDHGITRILSVYVVVHTTDYSVLVQESATCAVATDTLTILTAAGNNGKRRIAVVVGE